MNIVGCDDSQKNFWNKFIAENNPECFLQSWEWGEFQRSIGRKIWRICVVSDGRIFQVELEDSKTQNPNLKTDIIAAALLVKHDLPFGMSYLYCPRGPVLKVSSIKYQVSRVPDLLFNEIKRIADKEKSLFLKIEPAVTKNMEHETWNMSDYSYKKSNNDIQPKNTLMLDLGKSKEDLLKEMKQKTRYNIRLAEKKRVKVFVSSNYEKDFSKFWKLVDETSKRNEIISHKKDYYLKILETLKENGVDKKCNLFSRLYLAEYNSKVIAGNIVLFFGDISIYLHGASSNEDRAVMAPYLLQWKQILDAKESGCKSYDFWGIAANGEKESWEGITRFKKGFGGYEKNYIGAYDLPFNSAGYILYKIAGKIRAGMK